MLPPPFVEKPGETVKPAFHHPAAPPAQPPEHIQQNHDCREF
jgi:hypothetical protein